MSSMNDASNASLERDLRPAALHVSDGGLLLAMLVAMLWGLGRYGLYEPHEGHFGGIGREMLLTGEWVVPHLNGSPYLNKPPLMYWSSAVCQALFGSNAFGARLPAALFGWLGIVVAWSWGRRLWGRMGGHLAAMALFLSVGWFLFTHQILTDVLVCTLNLAALYAVWLMVGSPSRKAYQVCFWGALSLAMLTKGPPGMMFPLLAALLFAWRRKRWELISKSGWGWGLVLVAVPIVLWAWMVQARVPGFLNHILGNEMWARLFDERWPPDYKVSKLSVVGYVLAAAIQCAPWTLLLPWIAPWSVRAARSKIEGDVHADAVLLLALGAALPIVVYLPIPSRLIYYCLPAVPPFALLVAGWWMSGIRDRQNKWGSVRWAGLVLAVVGAVTASAAFWVVPLIKNIPDLTRATATLDLIPVMALLLGGALVAGGALMFARKPYAGAWALFVVMAFAQAKATDGFAAYEDLRASRNLVAAIQPRLPTHTLWVYEGSFELGAAGGFAFYLGVDEAGRPHTVRVLVDDPRRLQPTFGQAPRDYAMKREQLREAWAADRPVVFVTDLMRRDWASKAEAPLQFVMDPEAVKRREMVQLESDWGVEVLGEPMEREYGFRRVYLNAAAREAWTRSSSH